MYNLCGHNTLVKEKKERGFAHIVLILMLCSMIEDIFYNLLKMLGMNTSFANYISWIIYGSIFVYVFFHLLKKNRIIELVLFETVTLVLIVLSKYLTPEVANLINGCLTTLLITNVVAYYIGKYGFAKNNLFKNIQSIIPYYVIIGLIYLFIIFLNEPDNYMNTSYNLLSVTCLCIIKAFNEKNFKSIKYFVLAAVFSLYIFLFGASGPFLTIIALSISLSLFKMKSWKRVIVVFFGLCFAGLVLLFHDQILIGLNNLFPNSRTFSKIFNENMVDSPRFLIWKYVVEYLRNNPFKINGLFADRVIITNGNVDSINLGYYVLYEQIGGLYAHNIFLELLMQFGMLVGSILILLLFYLFYRFFKAARTLCFSWEKKSFILGIFFIAVVPLLFSSSYLASFNFWMMLGILKSVKQLTKYKYQSAGYLNRAFVVRQLPSNKE